MYHKDTYEIVTREVWIARRCHSTDIYLDRLWNSLDAFRPDIDSFIASLERNIQTRSEDIMKYPDDYAHINECREYIRRHREWIALIPGISQQCEKNEAHNNAIYAELERSLAESEERERVRQLAATALPSQPEPVQVEQMTWQEWAEQEQLGAAMVKNGIPFIRRDSLNERSAS